MGYTFRHTHLSGGAACLGLFHHLWTRKLNSSPITFVKPNPSPTSVSTIPSAEKLLISGSIATSKPTPPVLMTAPENPSPALIRPTPTSPTPYLKPDAVTPPGALRNYSNFSANPTL